MSKVNEVLSVDRRRIRAMVQADIQTLEDILADDLTYTHTNCVVDSKRSLIEKIESRVYDYVALDAEGVHGGVFDDRVAVLTGSALMKIRVNKEIVSVPICFTNVYAYRDGRWQMLAWQSTHKS